MLIDVDGLKTINDNEGHEEGDKAIWTVATAIKKLVRGNDFLIRWGGDEFLVILPEHGRGVAKKRFYMLPAQIDEVRQSPNLPAVLSEVSRRLGRRDAVFLAGAVRRRDRAGGPRHVRTQESVEGDARTPRRDAERERTDA